MIGDLITINGTEWEEISYEEYLYLKNTLVIYSEDKEIGVVKSYYKKVVKEVFQKVFKGRYFNYKVFSDNNIELDFTDGTLLLDKVEIEALKQALAFRDKMLEGKK